MITALIICLTIIFCVVWITLWIKHMVVRNLPLFTYGQCVWKPEEDALSKQVNNPIGFTPSVSEETESDTGEQKSDKEKKESLAEDPTTLITALLRGEVDIDELNVGN